MNAYRMQGEIDIYVGKFQVRVKPCNGGFSFAVFDKDTNANKLPRENSCKTFREARDKGVAWAEAQADQVDRNGRLP